MMGQDKMTQLELDALAREAQADPSAMANFGLLLGFLYLAGGLRVDPAKTHRPNRTPSDVRTDGKAA